MIILEEMTDRFHTWIECYTLDDKYHQLRDLLSTNLEQPTEITKIYLVGVGKTTALNKCINYFDTHYDIIRLPNVDDFTERTKFINTATNKSITVKSLYIPGEYLPMEKHTITLIFKLS